VERFVFLFSDALLGYRHTGVSGNDEYSYDSKSLLLELQDRANILAMVPSETIAGKPLEATPSLLLRNFLWSREPPWSTAEKLLILVIFPEGYSVSNERVTEVEVGLRLALETEYSADFPASVKVCQVSRQVSNPVVLGLLSVPVRDLYGGTIAVAEPVRGGGEATTTQAEEVVVHE